MGNQAETKNLPAAMKRHILREKLGRLRKKKSFWIILLIAVILIVALIAGLISNARGAGVQAAEMTVQSAEAEKGSISTTVVGTGSLAAGTTTDVVVPTGIKVKEVLVESGDTVKAGDTLATLEEASIAGELLEVKESIESVQEEIDNLSGDADDSSTTEYLEAKVLNGELADLKKAESTLTALLESQKITASSAGTVSSINVSKDTEITTSASSGSTSGSSGGNSSVSNSNMSTGNTTAAEGNMSTGSTAAAVSNMSTAGAAAVSMNMTAAVSESEAADAQDEVQADQEISLMTLTEDQDAAAASADTSITECVLGITAPAAGGSPQTDLEETEMYSGTITWNCSTETFQSNTAYTATIKLTAKDGYAFSHHIIPEVTGAEVISEVRQGDNGESILYMKAKFARTGEDENSKNDGQSGESENKSSENGSAANGTEGGSGSSGGSSDTQGASSGGTGSGSSGTASAGSDSSISASGGSSSSGSTSDSTGSSSSNQYSAYETAAFTIASGENMTVSINVDELDILSVKEGQTAVVTLDALDGQEFEGSISNVSTTASSGSSSAKYPVEITLDKTEDMILGMSASATIQISESEDAVLIPISALQESGGSTFVYTGQDEDGSLTDKVEVETGLSNGSQVEITSGLNDGDTVYYLKSESTDSGSGFEMMGGQDGMMPDGEMPGGQDMQGGGPGGDRSSDGGRGQQ